MKFRIPYTVDLTLIQQTLPELSGATALLLAGGEVCCWGLLPGALGGLAGDAVVNLKKIQYKWNQMGTKISTPNVYFIIYHLLKLFKLWFFIRRNSIFLYNERNKPTQCLLISGFK